MNVTPESDAPIIPYATINHGDFLFPVKNVSFVALREVKCEIRISSAKYPITIPAIRYGFIISNLLQK